MSAPKTTLFPTLGFPTRTTDWESLAVSFRSRTSAAPQPHVSIRFHLEPAIHVPAGRPCPPALVTIDGHLDLGGGVGGAARSALTRGLSASPSAVGTQEGARSPRLRAGGQMRDLHVPPVQVLRGAAGGAAWSATPPGSRRHYSGNTHRHPASHAKPNIAATTKAITCAHGGTRGGGR